ncbi:MAG: GNAT family N-acetyltransferase [Actinomycetota bacterium]
MGPRDGLPVLRGHHVLLRPIERADLDHLMAIRTEPSVAQWWGNVDPASPEREFLDEETATFVIEPAGRRDEEGEIAGCVQFTEETEPAYRHAAIDIFLGASWQGRGLGRDALRTLARHLFDDRGHHRLTIDPAAANERAIRTYAAVGFRPVGVLRDYERGRDGTWHDGLLMDLLAGELT